MHDMPARDLAERMVSMGGICSLLSATARDAYKLYENGGGSPNDMLELSGLLSQIQVTLLVNLSILGSYMTDEEFNLFQEMIETLATDLQFQDIVKEMNLGEDLGE